MATTWARYAHSRRYFSLLFGYLTLLLVFSSLVGCTPPSPPPPPASSTHIGKKALGENDSEHSLDNLKTIIGTLERRNHSFILTPCDTQTQLRVVDTTNGQLQHVFSALTKAAKRPIFVFATTPENRSAHEQVVIREIMYASQLQDAWGCSEKYEAFEFKAQGNEPGWAAWISDQAIRFSSIALQESLLFQSIKTTTTPWQSSFWAHNATHSLSVTITKEECFGTMADEWYGYRARAVLDGKFYSGCAKPGNASP